LILLKKVAPIVSDALEEKKKEKKKKGGKKERRKEVSRRASPSLSVDERCERKGGRKEKREKIGTPSLLPSPLVTGKKKRKTSHAVFSSGGSS